MASVCENNSPPPARVCRLRSLNNNFTGENEPSKTMRQLKGLIRLVKGGEQSRVCLTAVVHAEGKRETDQRRKGGE